MIKGGSAIYCPACNHRQVLGSPGEKLAVPMTVACEKCSAALVVNRSDTGGAHVTVQGVAAQ